jgi:hypothetical protein
MAAPPDNTNLVSRFDPRVLTALSGLDLKARYLVEGFLQGIHESPCHGLSVEFSEYRDYQPGDDLRHLDWQLFARSDRLYVKQYTQETNVRLYVVCDTSASMAYRGRDAWGSKLDVARILAAALSWMLLRQNDAVGLLALSSDEDHPDAFRHLDDPMAAQPSDIDLEDSRFGEQRQQMEYRGVSLACSANRGYYRIEQVRNLHENRDVHLECLFLGDRMVAVMCENGLCCAFAQGNKCNFGRGVSVEDGRKLAVNIAVYAMTH